MPKRKCPRNFNCSKAPKHRGACKIPSVAVVTETGPVLVSGFKKALATSAPAIHDFIEQAKEANTLDLPGVVSSFEKSRGNITFSQTNIEKRETEVGVQLDVDRNELQAVGFDLEAVISVIKEQLDKSKIHTSEYGRCIRDQLKESLGLLASDFDDNYVQETMDILKKRAVDKTRDDLTSVANDLAALPASTQPAIIQARERLEKKKLELENLLEDFTGKKTISSVAPKFRLKKRTPLQRQYSSGLSDTAFVCFDSI